MLFICATHSSLEGVIVLGNLETEQLLTIRFANWMHFNIGFEKYNCELLRLNGPYKIFPLF